MQIIERRLNVADVDVAEWSTIVKPFCPLISPQVQGRGKVICLNEKGQESLIKCYTGIDHICMTTKLGNQPIPERIIHGKKD